MTVHKNHPAPCGSARASARPRWRRLWHHKHPQ